MATLTRNRHVIAVHDLASCADWYTRVLAFQPEWIGDDEWVFLHRDAVTIMAGKCPDDIPPPELGCHQYFAYLETDNLDAEHARALREGADIIKPRTDEPWGMREFGLRTADGHRIMLGQPIITR
jgi:predicted enzyme related to lactoylglutathione lyase